jgi:hypothetical protein
MTWVNRLIHWFWTAFFYRHRPDPPTGMSPEHQRLARKMQDDPMGIPEDF